MNPKRPAGYNPLDPEQRIERARLRQLYFRQAGLFPAVAVAMAAFFALALVRSGWAVPYLIYVMGAPGLSAILQKLVAGEGDGRSTYGALGRVLVATAALLPFVVVSAPVWPSLLAALAVVLAAGAILAGRART